MFLVDPALTVKKISNKVKKKLVNSVQLFV